MYHVPLNLPPTLNHTPLSQPGDELTHIAGEEIGAPERVPLLLKNRHTLVSLHPTP